MESHKTHSSENSHNKKNWYDRWYKLILLPPIILLVVCLVYLFIFYQQNGDLIYRDPSLKGGTTITLQGNYNSNELSSKLKLSLPDVNIRSISDVATGRQLALIIDSSAEPEKVVSAIESALNIKLTSDNSNIEFSGSTLGENFYRQLIFALIISFLLMSTVIFFLFRTFIPCIAVIFAAFADIVIPLALINYLGIPLSAAGIAAFLMLIGYSVDTDILLTTRVLKKKEGSVNQRIFSSFKTGIFMNITALLAVLPAFLIVTGLPDSFRQIFLILAFGLFADIMNTWLTNASIIKWYADYKKII